MSSVAKRTKRQRPSEGNSFENQIDLEKPYLNARWSDVKFLFDSGNGTESILANKAVLAAQSDVFATMFYGELKETGDITVTDASIDGFKEFLQFFYLNQVELTIENVAEVMNLGHKYNVSKCVDDCATFSKDRLNNDSACIGLSLAILYEQQELKERCEEFINDHSEAVFKSKSFCECDKQVLAYILKLDGLNCAETTVFEACMSWIKAKSKQNDVTKQLIQEYLGKLFYKIRFTSMKMKDFDALSTAHEYAFSFAEYKDIMHTFASPDVSSKLFNGKPRQKVRYECAVINCDRKKADSAPDWWFMSYNQPTKFESNQPLLLGQLVFAPISIRRNGAYVEEESDFPIDVTIIEAVSLNNADDGSTRTLSTFQINLPWLKETSIKLPAPVSVRPGFYYEIRLNAPKCKTYQHYYKCGNLMAEVQMENSLKITFHGDRRFNDSYLVNLITGFGFNQI